MDMSVDALMERVPAIVYNCDFQIQGILCWLRCIQNFDAWQQRVWDWMVYCTCGKITEKGGTFYLQVWNHSTCVVNGRPGRQSLHMTWFGTMRGTMRIRDHRLTEHDHRGFLRISRCAFIWKLLIHLLRVADLQMYPIWVVVNTKLFGIILLFSNDNINMMRNTIIDS